MPVEGTITMQMLYNSDHYVVVQIDVPAVEGSPGLSRGGFEIVDKLARREIFIEGALAESFQQGVQALIDKHEDAETASADEFDEFIERYTQFAQHPLTLH